MASQPMHDPHLHRYGWWRTGSRFSICNLRKTWGLLEASSHIRRVGTRVDFPGNPGHCALPTGNRVKAPPTLSFLQNQVNTFTPLSFSPLSHFSRKPSVISWIPDVSLARAMALSSLYRKTSQKDCHLLTSNWLLSRN